MNEILFKKNSIIISIFLITIIFFSIFAASEIRTISISGIFASTVDDPLHLSLSNNWVDGMPFKSSITPVRFDFTTDELMSRFSSAPHDSPGSPLYHIILGNLIQLLSPSIQDQLLFGSYFTTFIVITLLVAIFFLIRKYFDIFVAFVSTLIISMSYILVWESVHVSNRALGYLFIAISFFFLEKNNKNYFLFAIIISLAHYSHTIAVIPLSAYLIFLLIHREFKGFLLIFSVYIIALSPLLAYHLFTFGDLGLSLGIPFSSQISGFLGFEKSFSMPAHISSIPIPISFSEYLGSMNEQFQALNLFSLEIILSLAIISTSVFFVSSILKTQNKFLLGLKKYSPNSRFLRFVLVYFVISIVTHFWISNNLSYVPNIRYLFPLMFVLVPILIYVFIKLLENRIQSKTTKIILIGIMLGVVFIIPSYYEMTESIYEINEYSSLGGNWKNQERSYEPVNEWLVNNISKNSTIVSNYHRIVYLGTNFNSISLPLDYRTTSDEYINYFEPDVLVLFNSDNTNAQILTDNSNDVFYILMYKYNESAGVNHKIFNIIEPTKLINDKLKSLQNSENNTSLVSALFITPTINGQIPDYSINLNLAQEYFKLKEYHSALKIYGDLVLIDPINIENWKSKLQIHSIQHQPLLLLSTIDSMNLNFERIHNKIPLHLSQSSNQFYSDIINYELEILLDEIEYQEIILDLNDKLLIDKVLSLIKKQNSINSTSSYNTIDLLLKFALLASEIKDESLEIALYTKILDIDRWNVSGLDGLAHAYEKNGDYQLARLQYEKLLRVADNPEKIQEKIDNLSKR